MTNPSLSHDQHVHPDVIRRNFSAALSAMYRKEVPLYGDLVTLVDEINNDVRKHGGSWETSGERLYNSMVLGHGVTVEKDVAEYRTPRCRASWRYPTR